MEVDLPGRSLRLDRPAVMGILNVTPDSFYDTGRYSAPEAARGRALAMVEEGADIIDIGGEKAGPGEPVTEEEEIRRVVPIVDAVRREVSTPISVDTFKPAVAQAALAAGAEIVNSIGGMRDPVMRAVAAKTRAAVVVMHIQGEPRVANPNPTYGNVVPEVVAWIEEGVALCLRDGISPRRIIVDPGPGFGKTAAHDLEVLRHLDRLVGLGYPVLLAASRKRFIGELLDLPPDERLEGSLAVAAWGALHGAHIFRVHDVRATRRVVDTVAAVLHPERVEARA